MPELSPEDVNRCRVHLGFDIPRGIPAAAELRFQEATKLIYSATSYYGKDGIKYWLDRCDRFLEESDPTVGGGFTMKQGIIGDVNRTTTTLSNSDVMDWWGLYLKQTDQLAFKLNVPNFRRPETARYLFERWGNEYIKALPGPPDTAIADKLLFSANLI